MKWVERKWRNKTHQDDRSVVVSTNSPQENTECSVSTLCQQVMALSWFFTSFQLIILQLANLCTRKIVFGCQIVTALTLAEIGLVWLLVPVTAILSPVYYSCRFYRHTPTYSQILLKYLLDKYRSQHRKFFQLTERFTENVRLTSVIIVEMEELTLKRKEPSYIW